MNIFTLLLLILAIVAPFSCHKSSSSEPDSLFGRNHVIIPGSKPDLDPALIIIVPGANLGPENYRDLANHIRLESDLNLWVAIADFPVSFS